MEWYKRFELENLSFVFNGVLYIERWEDIQGYIGLYQISSFGRLKSLSKWHRGSLKADTIMKQISGDKRGYLKVNLLIKSNRKTFRIHKLVAQYFCIKNDDNKVVNHLDSIITNNFYKNLEWTTSSGNAIHAFRFGFREPKRGSEVYNSKLKENNIPEIRKLFDTGVPINEIASRFIISKQTVRDVLNKRSWHHIK